MAFKKPEKKEENKPQKPQKGVPGRPFGQKGLTSPTYKRRNPHKDSGDKKPSLKTKASIIKEKAKKGQGLKRGGVAKALGAFPFIGRSLRQKGTISTIGALKPIPFIGKPLKKAMGGEASTSISRAELMMKNRDRRRKETQEMLERLYGKKKIVPKKKPLKKKDGGDIKENSKGHDKEKSSRF